MAAFLSLKKAEACALKFNGDVRYPSGCETYAVFDQKAFTAEFMANLLKPASACGSLGLKHVLHLGAAGSSAAAGTNAAGLNATTRDHPTYKRPVSATKHFFVVGKPSSDWIVAAGDCGCTAKVFSVYAGSGAQAKAAAQATKLQEEDDALGKSMNRSEQMNYKGDDMGYTYWAEQLTVGAKPGMTWNMRSCGCLCGECERVVNCPRSYWPNDESEPEVER